MKLQDRVTILEARVEKLAAAADRGVQSLRPGTAVSYMPITGYLGVRSNILWSGRVIPLPVGARTHGNSGDPLVWVIRDGDNMIRGCYAHNLVRR